jgi:hypothetical protein
MLHVFLASVSRATCTAHLILDLINLIIFVEMRNCEMNGFLYMVSPSPEPILWVRYCSHQSLFRLFYPVIPVEVRL